MDAAQMLTAREIARQCEQLARTIRHGEESSEPRRTLRLAEPVTEPIPLPPVDEPEPEQPEPSAVLSDREQAILAFERQWWKRSGAKERAIAELFDMSASRYYQVVNALLDKPAALRADPLLIKRLRRARASRQRVRAAQRLGIELH